MHNLIGEPSLQGVVTEMRLQMLRWVMATSDTVPFEKDQRWSKPMIMFKARRSVPPERMAELEALIDSGVPFISALIRCGGSLR